MAVMARRAAEHVLTTLILSPLTDDNLLSLGTHTHVS